MNPRPGIRALGIAESTRGDACTIAGAVVRGDGIVDGAAFATATVGGLDATDAVIAIGEELDREDLRFLALGTVAPAWYNMIDVERVADETGLATVTVTFEASTGLEAALADAFSGVERDRRLAIYRSLPSREPCRVNDETVYVRSVGIESDTARELVETFTPTGGRPEPIRVARELARAAASYRERIVGGELASGGLTNHESTDTARADHGLADRDE